MTTDRKQAARKEPEPATAERPERVVQAEELFQGEKTLIIEHQGTRYVLRTTRNGKLLLTK